MSNEYRQFLNSPPSSQSSQPSSPSSSEFGGSSERVRASVAESLGTTAEAARSAQIDRNIAHQIVEQAYQKQQQW